MFAIFSSPLSRAKAGREGLFARFLKPPLPPSLPSALLHSRLLLSVSREEAAITTSEGYLLRWARSAQASMSFVCSSRSIRQASAKHVFVPLAAAPVKVFNGVERARGRKSEEEGQFEIFWLRSHPFHLATIDDYHTELVGNGREVIAF